MNAKEAKAKMQEAVQMMRRAEDALYAVVSAVAGGKYDGVGDAVHCIAYHLTHGRTDAEGFVALLDDMGEADLSVDIPSHGVGGLLRKVGGFIVAMDTAHGDALPPTP